MIWTLISFDPSMKKLWLIIEGQYGSNETNDFGHLMFHIHVKCHNTLFLSFTLYFDEFVQSIVLFWHTNKYSNTDIPFVVKFVLFLSNL